MKFPVILQQDRLLHLSHLGQLGDIILGHLHFLGHSLARSFPPHSALRDDEHDREVFLVEEIRLRRSVDADCHLFEFECFRFGSFNVDL